MITNPTPGMKVRINDPHHYNHNQVGRIIRSSRVQSQVVIVRLDGNSETNYYVNVNSLEAVPFSSEEEEQKRREHHAMKYL